MKYKVLCIKKMVRLYFLKFWSKPLIENLVWFGFKTY